MPLPHTEAERRHLVVMTFVTSAIAGDVGTFLRNTLNIDWPGAWLEIFTRLAPIPREMIDDGIRDAFFWAWRGSKENLVPIGKNWGWKKDLEDHVDLQVACMKILAPEYKSEESPYVLYRGQWLSKHNEKSYGIWWTPCPVYASYYATDRFERYSGQGVVLATVAPHQAIISQLNPSEFLVDPNLLGDVHAIDVPPRCIEAERLLTPDEKDARSRVIGIPNGYDVPALKEWIAGGMRLEGIPRCRDFRLRDLEHEMAA